MNKNRLNIVVTICVLIVCISIILVGCGEKRKPEDLLGTYTLNKVAFREIDGTDYIYYNFSDIESIQNENLKTLLSAIYENHSKRRFEITQTADGDFFYNKQLLSSTGKFATTDARKFTGVAFEETNPSQYILTADNEEIGYVNDIDGEFVIFDSVDSEDRQMKNLLSANNFEIAKLYYIKK